MHSRQGASSRPEVGRRGGRNIGGCLPTCPRSFSEQRSAVPKSHLSQDHSGASLRCSCKRRKKESLVQISQQDKPLSSLAHTGCSQTVEEAETRFRSVDEIWKLLEELVELWLSHSASSFVGFEANNRTFVLFRECIGVYDIEPSDIQKFR